MGFRCWLVSLLFVSLPVALVAPAAAVGADHYISIEVDYDLSDPVVINPLHQTLQPGDTLTWDNMEWNRYIDILDSSGTRWCRLWGDSSGQTASRCTLDPGLPVGFHTYFVTHQTEGTRAAFLCVTESSSINITSPPSGYAFGGSVAVTGTAASDLGIDRVEVRAGGGPWTVAEGTASWSVVVSTEGATTGAGELEARAVRQQCNVATSAIEVVITDTPVLDLAVTRMYAQRQDELLGNYYSISWSAANTGNSGASVIAHIERLSGIAWIAETTVSLAMDAYSARDGFYESGLLPSGIKWRLRLEVVEASTADNTPLDHIGYWPYGGPGAPQTILARRASFGTPDLTVTEATQVAWQWFGAEYGITGEGGVPWCPATADFGALCYVSLPSAGRFDYAASTDAAVSGILRLPGDPPEFSITPLPEPVTGTIRFEGVASSPHGVRFLDLRVGSGEWFSVDPLAPWSHAVDTLAQHNGPLELAVRATGEDNSASQASIVVVVDNPLMADLTPSAVTVQDGTLTDSTARVVATISNTGNTPATADVILRVYASGVWSEVDRRTVTVGAFSDVGQSLRWRCDTCLGSYSAQVIVDPENTVAERDETNNLHSTNLRYRTVGR